MYHVGVCDDSVNICSFIEKCLLQKAGRENIVIKMETWYSGEELWSYLQTEDQIDVLFLDIELLDMTGIEVAENIRKQLENWEIQIIYISGKTNYAQSLFKTQPMDFLVKPLDAEQIEEAFDTARKIISKGMEKFEFQNGKEHYFVAYSQIVYFTSSGRTVNIITINGNRGFYGKLKEISKNLPHDFIIIHQSYIVNSKYIKRYVYETIELEDGTILPISKVYRKQVRQRLLREG